MNSNKNNNRWKMRTGITTGTRIKMGISVRITVGIGITRHDNI
jgi:hypothetical protein